MLDEETENLYIQNIEEFVLDENKVVTYKWLSKTLGVHVNTAKQLLYAFATQSGEAKTAGIKKTYLVSGVLLNDGGCKVTVVQEDNLQKLKDQFKIITSEHIYSVQKVKNDTALSDLYKVDSCQKDDSNPVPAISCSKCLLRTDSELSKLRLKAEAATVTSDSKQWPTGPSKKPAASKSPVKNTNNPNKHVSNGDAETAEKAEGNSAVAKNGTKGSIAAMFAAQGSKAQKSAESAKAPAKSTAKGKSGGIATFFNKNVGETSGNTEKHIKKQKKEVVSDVEKQNSVKNDHCLSLKETDSSPEKKRKSFSEKSEQESTSTKRRKISEDKIDSVETNVKSKKVVDTKSNKSKKPNKKKEKGNNSEKSVKKRKRIILADSDSDDDIFEKEEVPESPPPPEEHEPELPSQRSEMEDIIPCTPQQELNKGRKRIRKLVDKTFMDEDGYMITKKEFVYESCSESDHEEGKENEVKASNESTPKNVKKETDNNVKESPKKKVSPPQKSKQATLMNFFKKS